MIRIPVVRIGCEGLRDREKSPHTCQKARLQGHHEQVGEESQGEAEAAATADLGRPPAFRTIPRIWDSVASAQGPSRGCCPQTAEIRVPRHTLPESAARETGYLKDCGSSWLSQMHPRIVARKRQPNCCGPCCFFYLGRILDETPGRHAPGRAADRPADHEGGRRVSSGSWRRAGASEADRTLSRTRVQQRCRVRDQPRTRSAETRGTHFQYAQSSTSYKPRSCMTCIHPLFIPRSRTLVLRRKARSYS